VNDVENFGGVRAASNVGASVGISSTMSTRVRSAFLIASLTACATPRPRFPLAIPSRHLEAGGAQVAAALDLAASPDVQVNGQVRNAGTIHYEPGLTLIGAIVDCGGFTELAEPWAIDVTRGAPPHHIRVSAYAILDGTQPDVALLPGDVVVVMENYF
jgi:protein involved in polysaccharide export with SLBB domain